MSVIDQNRRCEICSGPIPTTNTTGVCRILPDCRTESDKRSQASITVCRVCGGPLRTRNKIGICRVNEKCVKEAKRIHDRNYHRGKNQGKPAKLPKDEKKDSWLLPEDGIVDEIAVWIAVSGVRHVALTRRERVEAVRRLLRLGAGVRDMCDNLHVHPAVVREILDELGYECVRNEHIAGSKIMVILPKNRARKATADS